jgi:hypothetical protein
MLMTKILTAKFASEDTLKNAEADILNSQISGFPNEKIFVDKDKKEIKVIASSGIVSEIREIFKAHGADSVTETDWKE